MKCVAYILYEDVAHFDFRWCRCSVDVCLNLITMSPLWKSRKVGCTDDFLWPEMVLKKAEVDDMRWHGVNT